jgi:hypothetical protein
MALCLAPPRCLLGPLTLLGLLLARPALAVPFLLPEGEPAAPWQAALALAGDTPLDPSELRVKGTPWVELQRTAQADQWRLRVRDHRGTLHEVEVFVPVTERQREVVVVLAASLLHPMTGGSGGLWDALAVAEEPPPLPSELPPPLPSELPPPLPREQPPPLPVEPPPLPDVLPPPLPSEVAPLVEARPAPEPPSAAPLAEVVPPSPDPEPVTPILEAAPPSAEPVAPSPAPEPVTVVPVGPASVVVWTRILGLVDAGLGAPDVAPGGGVQVGAVLHSGFRLGVGFESEWFRSLPLEGQDPEHYAEIQESGAHICLLWSPSWGVAPLVALRGGVGVRTLYKQQNVGGGVYERQAVSTWVDESTGEEHSLGPHPTLGLELGFGVPLGPALRLQPFAHLQADPSGSWSFDLTRDQRVELSPFSLHAGLALHLQPEARSE